MRRERAVAEPPRLRLLTASDAAAELGINERTVRRMALRRELPFVLVAGRYRFVPGDLSRWIEAHRET